MFSHSLGLEKKKRNVAGKFRFFPHLPPSFFFPDKQFPFLLYFPSVLEFQERSASPDARLKKGEAVQRDAGSPTTGEEAQEPEKENGGKEEGSSQEIHSVGKEEAEEEAEDKGAAAAAAAAGDDGGDGGETDGDRDGGEDDDDDVG